MGTVERGRDDAIVDGRCERTRAMIRTAQPDDAGDVAALLVRLRIVHHTADPDAFAPTTSDEQEDLFRQQHLATARSHALVAEANGRVVGYLWARLAEASPLDSSWPRRFVEIDTLVVAVHAQGMGIGRQLLEAAATWTTTQGVAETRLVVYEANPAAFAFYERLGYTTRTRTLQRRLAVEQ
jgi:ribosomal protein S18 acetylase RimI-like enzyme